MSACPGRMTCGLRPTQASLRLPASASQGLKLTYDDYLLFPEDGKRHELIDGEHYATPSPAIRHQRVSGNLLLVLARWLDRYAVGEVFHGPLDVLLSEFDVVVPDLLYVSNERAGKLLTENYVAGPPDLVVEITSTETRKRDETIKRRLYEKSGVTEYWIVDPDIDVIRAFRREGDRFARPVELSGEAGDVLTTSLLPGLEIPLSEVLRD